VPSLTTLAETVRRHDSELKLALRVATAALIGHLAARLIGLSQGYWVTITAVIVMQASLGGSVKAAADRMAGTLVGAAYGAVVAVTVPHQMELGFVIAIVLAVTPMALLAALNASFRVAPITALIVLTPATDSIHSPLAYALERVFEIALGNLIGVAVALFVLPARAHSFVAGAAARIAELNADLLSALIEGLTQDQGRPGLPALHAKIRAALKQVDMAADEAARERRSHFTDRADPEPLVRTLYRLRHDLVMVGRASAKRLPKAIEPLLQPALFAIRDGGVAMLRGVAKALMASGPAPGIDMFDAALKEYVTCMDRLRAEGRTRSLGGEEMGRLHALRFAFEQLGLDLRDLADRVDEIADPGKRVGT
jgi:uncharacterized membrane protein YccC